MSNSCPNGNYISSISLPAHSGLYEKMRTCLSIFLLIKWKVWFFDLKLKGKPFCLKRVLLRVNIPSYYSPKCNAYIPKTLWYSIHCPWRMILFIEQLRVVFVYWLSCDSWYDEWHLGIDDLIRIIMVLKAAFPGIIIRKAVYHFNSSCFIKGLMHMRMTWPVLICSYSTNFNSHIFIPNLPKLTRSKIAPKKCNCIKSNCPRKLHIRI